MSPEEWQEQVGNELDDICSSANAVLQEMLQDGTWEGSDPSETVKQVLLSMFPEEGN